MLAIANKDFELFTTLLLGSPNVNEADLNGRTALMYACSFNRPKMVTALVERGANLHQRDVCGKSALAHSCHNISILTYLLELGAEVDSIDRRCRTILMTACEKGNFKAVSVLLDHGANINLIDNDDQSVLDVARKFKRYEIIQQLKINQNSVFGSGNINLTTAVIADDFKLFTVLVSDCDDMDETDLGGQTTLMQACFFNRPKMVAALLKKGANPHIQDNDGRTALMFSFNYTDILVQLLRMKVDVKYKSKDGKTPLMVAFSCENPIAVYCLLAYGTIDISDEGDETSLLESRKQLD
ncbi:MAG: hypothetical protein A6F71_08425 [Cycloclasticus sp. symbiont of Poecilosclerida sp. M]|nr:MAG: hypothetical protein A6F71_08425 [Cycloclasticus sp. symbiont of Poecilosclerida sp. M]